MIGVFCGARPLSARVQVDRAYLAVLDSRKARALRMSSTRSACFRVNVTVLGIEGVRAEVLAAVSSPRLRC